MRLTMIPDVGAIPIPTIPRVGKQVGVGSTGKKVSALQY
jgi:hypothetical protein